MMLIAARSVTSPGPAMRPSAGSRRGLNTADINWMEAHAVADEGEEEPDKFAVEGIGNADEWNKR